MKKKKSHSAFQRSNTLIPGNIFSWNVGKPKPVPTLSNHCFSYVNGGRATFQDQLGQTEGRETWEKYALILSASAWK